MRLTDNLEEVGLKGLKDEDNLVTGSRDREGE